MKKKVFLEKMFISCIVAVLASSSLIIFYSCSSEDEDVNMYGDKEKLYSLAEKYGISLTLDDDFFEYPLQIDSIENDFKRIVSLVGNYKLALCDENSDSISLVVDNREFFKSKTRAQETFYKEFDVEGKKYMLTATIYLNGWNGSISVSSNYTDDYSHYIGNYCNVSDDTLSIVTDGTFCIHKKKYTIKYIVRGFYNRAEQDGGIAVRNPSLRSF